MGRRTMTMDEVEALANEESATASSVESAQSEGSACFTPRGYEEIRTPFDHENAQEKRPVLMSSEPYMVLAGMQLWRVTASEAERMQAGNLTITLGLKGIH